MTRRSALLTTVPLSALLSLPAMASADTCYIRPPFTVGDTWHCTDSCGRTTPHAGVDFPAPIGTPVPSIADGTVVVVDWSDCLGNVLVIQHPDGLFSGYAHLSAIHVGVGQGVARGQHVADVGETGSYPDCVTGPHLHMTMGDHLASYYDRATIDPLAYIDSHSVCSCDRTNGHMTFTCDGANAGATCVSLNEPEDPESWVDNHLCTPTDEGLVFSTDGPVEGMRCAQLGESADTYAAAWADDYVCARDDAYYELSWSAAGPIPGWSCVHFNEPADPGTWNDNYLCERGVSCFGAGGFTFCAAGAPEGESCVNVDEPSDPNTWTDNFFCASEEAGGDDVGLVWSYTGPIEGMKCTNVVEPSDAQATFWTDNYLCVPEDSEYTFTWSNAGRIEGQDCVRWYEASDVAGTWTDNYLCVQREIRTPDAGPPRPDGGRADAGVDAGRVDRTPTSGCACAAGRASAFPAMGWLVLLALLSGSRARARTSASARAGAASGRRTA